MPDEPLARQDTPARPAADRTPGELALDLTSEAVRLLARDASGAWTELGTVPLAAGGFRAGIDALRRQAAPSGAPAVTLWLPPDQILVRRYVLKRGDRGAEALGRLADDTGHGAGELTVALSPADDGELVTVLGTFRQTVAEALDYARRWGFEPVRVSTRVESERFGAAGPAFEMPDRAGPPAGLRGRQALAAAAAALLAVGVGAWAIWGAPGLSPASGPGSEPAPAVVASAPEVTAPLADEKSGRAPAPPTPVGRGSGEADKAGPSMPAGPATTPLRRAAEPVRSEATGDRAGPPPQLASTASHAQEAPARLALGSRAPEPRRPADRPRGAAAGAGADLAALQAGIERIRSEGRFANGQVRVSDDGADDEAASGGDSGGQTAAAASDLAPDSVPGRPMPRPGDAAPAEAAAGPPPAGPPAAGAPAGDDALAGAGAEEGQVEAEGSDVPPPPAEMSDSRLAVVQAPPPPARPEAARRPERLAAHRAVAAPPRVGSAAAQQGIALDATSLIGVIDANSGREALLRLPSGDFRKVARGDEVAGWRVNAIGENALRLTRGRESRTLLLVTR